MARFASSVCMLGVVAAAVVAFSIAEAAETCVKVTFKGDASTYNPNYAGWKTGGQSLATGGRYNPNEYEAALQLDRAKQYRCGYGSGAICHAVVQAPNGRAAIVRINDNGPLTSGRVIDLNEKSMQYLSGGTMGRNSGVLKNVTVTLLCSLDGQQLGPLDEKERQAWLSRTFNAPNVGWSGASPYTVGQARTIGTPFSSGATSAQLLEPSDDYCITSIEPLVVMPRGAVPESHCYNARQQQTVLPPPPPPASAPPPAPPPSSTPPPQQTQTQPTSATNSGLSQQLLSGGQASQGGSAQTQAAPKPVANLIAQPLVVARGDPIVVSWSSVGMNTKSCIVRSGDTVLAQKNEGTKIVSTTAVTPRGTMSFVLVCTSRGQDLEFSTQVTVK